MVHIPCGRSNILEYQRATRDFFAFEDLNLIDLPFYGDTFTWVGVWCFFSCFDGFVEMFSGVYRPIVVNELFILWEDSGALC